ncbi:MAG: hypothetical protein LQ342_000548 [Letrouitia transgressa]|nr:MAG: hypothetical protein LQ342_000548 [Letrouitia transgressa]
MRFSTPLCALLTLLPSTLTLVYAAPFSRPAEPVFHSPSLVFDYRVPSTTIFLEFSLLSTREPRRIVPDIWGRLISNAHRAIALHSNTHGGPSAILREALRFTFFDLRFSIVPQTTRGGAITRNGATYLEVNRMVSALLIAGQHLDCREFKCRIYRTSSGGQPIHRIGEMTLEYPNLAGEEVAALGSTAENLTVASLQTASEQRQLITSRQINAITFPIKDDGGGATSNNIIPFKYHVPNTEVLLEAHNIPDRPIRYIETALWTQVLREGRRRLLMKFGPTGLERNMHDVFLYRSKWTEVDVWPNTDHPAPMHFATYRDAYEVMRGMYDISGRVQYQELWVDFYRTDKRGTVKGMLLGHATFEKARPFEEITNQTAVAEFATSR